MREILYIQAGRLANYTGTHFWNCQEKYFTYDDETKPLTDHDISFREGLDAYGNATYCPRLLMFDARNNFGRLSSANSLKGYDKDLDDASDGTEPHSAVWGGEVIACRQEPIFSPPSGTRISDAAPSSNSSEMYTDSELGRAGQKSSDPEVPFWSDFAQASYTPRTIQKIPETPDWDRDVADWTVGHDTYLKYNDRTGLMEDAVRLSLEECDSPQGLQIIEDTETFGSFINSLITSFHDELAKLPVLSFPLLSDCVPANVDSPRDLKRMINDALVLRSFDDIQSASCIPIQHQTHWYDKIVRKSTNSHVSPYLASAVLCSHLETSTLPLRTKNSPSSLTLSSLLAQLNWRGTTKFSQLSCIPLYNASEPFDESLPLSDFSSPAMLKAGLSTQYACLDVTRGLSEEDLLAYDRWRLQISSTCPVSSIHAQGYPLDEALHYVRTPRPRSSVKPSPETVRVFTRTETTARTAQMVDAYAKAIQEKITHKPSMLVQHTGLELDVLKELVNDLWSIHDNYDDFSNSDLAMDEPDTE